MKAVLRQIIGLTLLVVMLWGVPASDANAQSGFDLEICFFGQNLSSFENSDWIEIMVGATASLFMHEFGHAMALELAGKSWDFQVSWPFGLAVHTDDNLSDAERLNIGRAGFALQSLIGFGLTLFEATRQSGFTKGWVSMNTLQISTYRSRPHDIDDDFAMIDKGGGNSNLEFSIFSLLSLNNQLRLESDPWDFMKNTFFKLTLDSKDTIDPIGSTNDGLFEETDIDWQNTILPNIDLSYHYMPLTHNQFTFNSADTLLAKRAPVKPYQIRQP